MNSNPHPYDPNSGHIGNLSDFTAEENPIPISEIAKEILDKIPSNQRVDYLLNSSELELAEERKALREKFALSESTTLRGLAGQHIKKKIERVERNITE